MASSDKYTFSQSQGRSLSALELKRQRWRSQHCFCRPFLLYLSQAVRKKKKQLYNFIATEDRSKDGNQFHPSSQFGDRVKVKIK